MHILQVIEVTIAQVVELECISAPASTKISILLLKLIKVGTTVSKKEHVEVEHVYPY